MATTGKVNGTKIGVYSGGTLIAHATSHTLNLEANMIDVSNKDSAGWAESIVGQKSWSIDIESLFTFDAAYGFEELYDAWTARTSLSVKFSTEVSGDIYFSGTVFVSSIPVEAPLEDATTYSVSLTGTGALTKATVA